MSEKPCDNVVAFVDGELDDATADAFRAHLARCEVCEKSVEQAVQLSAQLSALKPVERR